MVGKYKSEDESNDYINQLKENNISLAKDLTQEKLLSKQYLSEKNWFQQKLHTATLLNFRYEAILNKLLTQSKKTLPSCIALTDNLAQMIKLCSEGVNLSTKLKADAIENSGKVSICPNLRPISPGISNKTRAVQPMVSGHVIFRPTINLHRLIETEHSLAESSSSNGNTSQNNEVESSQTERLADNVGDNLFLGNNQPIRSFQLSNTIDNINENDVDLLDGTETNDVNVPVILEAERLSVLLEENNESIHEQPITTNTLRKVSIVINSILPKTSPECNMPIFSDNSASRSDTSLNYDPIEGPSNLLDNRGHVRRVNIKSERKFRYIVCASDDSESDKDEWNPTLKSKMQSKKNLFKYGNKLNSNKRKANNALQLTDKAKYDRKSSKKIKRSATNKELVVDLKEPYVVLTKLPQNLELPQRNDVGNNSSISSTTPKKSSNSVHHQPLNNKQSQNGSVSENRPKRSRQISSYKETSLNCKLRREK